MDLESQSHETDPRNSFLNEFNNSFKKQFPYMSGFIEFVKSIELVIMTLYNLGFINVKRKYIKFFIIYLQILYVRVTIESVYRSFIKFMKKKEKENV